MSGVPVCERAHYVYRCFDDAGRLLYIGSALNVADRMHYHRILSSQSPPSRFLRHHMVSHTQVEYPSLTAARAAEKTAIADEAPLLNRLHNKGRGLDPEFYLWLSVQQQREYLTSLPAPAADPTFAVAS